jgi:hypothetical protein
MLTARQQIRLPFDGFCVRIVSILCLLLFAVYDKNDCRGNASVMGGKPDPSLFLINTLL